MEIVSVNPYANLFFDSVLHKYTDDKNNIYTSTTTLIHKYYEGFDAIKMSRVCELSGRKGNPKYRGKTAKMLQQEWARNSKDACDYGNGKHGYLEDSIKSSTGYRIGIKNNDANGKMLTVKDVVKYPGFGELNIDYFIQTKINILYPSIFNIILNLVQQGYRIYAEIGVFKPDRLISGTIDLLLIKGNEFIILDWKTNKADFTYEAGYWENDEDGNLTGRFVPKYTTFFNPLSHLPDSVGYVYTLQLSTYAYLCEILGLTCKAIVLCHIRRELLLDKSTNTMVERVDFHPISYLKNEVTLMIDHHYTNRKLNKQLEITR